MKIISVLALAVLAAGCNAEQVSPVAPAAVLPAGSGGSGLPTFTSFDVTLSNGTTYAIADGPWLGFLSVQPHTGAQITTPRSVTVDCGNGTVQNLGTGIGVGMVFTCRWSQAGPVTVQATVEAQNGVTTVATLPLQVQPPLVVEEPVSVALSAAIAPGGHEWVFTPTTIGRVVSLLWDFGDGAKLETGPGQVMRHSFNSHGVFTVTATPRLEDGSTRPGAYMQILND